MAADPNNEQKFVVTIDELKEMFMRDRHRMILAISSTNDDEPNDEE